MTTLLKCFEDWSAEWFDETIEQLVEKRRNDGMPCKTGKTMAALKARPTQSRGGSPVLDQVIYIDDGQVPYAKFLETGTGLFGPKRRPITPNGNSGGGGQFLKFDIGGDTIFAKESKGSGKYKGFWSEWDWDKNYCDALEDACRATRGSF
jgi:hypothetical protein